MDETFATGDKPPETLTEKHFVWRRLAGGRIQGENIPQSFDGWLQFTKALSD